MNHRHILCASIFLAAPLAADIVINHQTGTFFDQDDLKEILQRVDVEGDILVLGDGKQLKGKVSGLPQVNFSFGKFPLGIEDVAAIAFSDVKENTKIQMITHDGYSFITDVSGKSIPFVQYYPSIKDSKRSENKEIEISEISHILLHRNSVSSQPKPSRLHILELNNGNKFPVLIAEEEISLSNGWEAFSVRPEALIDVNFDGGLYGTIQDRLGNESDLGFSFVNDRHLRVKVLRSPQTIGIPWSEVYAIRKQKVHDYNVAEFVAKSVKTEDVKKPKPLMRQKVSDHPPEGIAWLEDAKPKAKFHPDSAQVGNENYVWMEKPEPKKQFHPDSANVGPESYAWVEKSEKYFDPNSCEIDRNDIAWVEHNPDAPSVEKEQIAMLQKEKTRLIKDWRTKQGSLEGKLSEAVNNTVKLQARLQEMEELNRELDNQNRLLTEEFTETADARDDLLEKQVYLASAIELEIARSNELRSSMADFHEKWKQAVSELKDEKEFTAQLQDKMGFLIDSLEVERDSKQEIEEALLHAKTDALEFERQVAQLSKDVELREERVYELQQVVESKYREISDIFREQKSLHQQLLNKVSALEEERESAKAIRDSLEKQLSEAQIQSKEHVAQHGEEIKNLQRSLEQSQNAMSRAEKERTEVEKIAARVQDQYEELKALIMMKTSFDPGHLESSAEVHTALVSEAEKLVPGSLLEERVATFNREIEEAHALISNLQEQLLGMTEKMRLAQSSNEEKEESLSAKMEEIAELKRFYSESEVQLSAQVEMLISEMETANVKVDSLAEGLELARSQNEEKAWEIQNLQSSLIEVQAGLHEMEHLLAEKEELLKEKDQKISVLASQLETFITKHEVFIKDRAELQTLIQMLKEKLDQKDSQIAELGDNLEQKEEEMALLMQAREVEVASLNEKMREIEKDKNAVQDLLSKSLDELEDKDFQIDSLARAQENYYAIRDRLEELENERLLFIREREEKLEQYTILRDESDKLIEANIALNEALKAAQAESGEASVQVNNLKEQLTRERKKSEDFKKKMDQLFPRYDVEREKGQQLQEELAKINAKLHQMENSLRVAETKEISAKDRLEKLSRENHQLARENEALLQQVRQEQNRLKEQRELAYRLNLSLQSQKPTMDPMEKSQLEHVSELERNERTNNYQIKKPYHPVEQQELGTKPAQESSLISFKGIHIVAAGENLNNISMKYYNTPHRWADIYEANQDVISDVNRLQVGTPLVIPD